MKKKLILLFTIFFVISILLTETLFLKKIKSVFAARYPGNEEPEEPQPPDPEPDFRGEEPDEPRPTVPPPPTPTPTPCTTYNWCTKRNACCFSPMAVFLGEFQPKKVKFISQNSVPTPVFPGNSQIQPHSSSIFDNVWVFIKGIF